MKSARGEEGAQRFAGYLVASGLDEDLRAICMAHRVTLRDIYLDSRGPTIVAARVESWWTLSARMRKSAREVGDIFDRDPSSVMHAMRKLGERARELRVELSESTVRSVAIDWAERAYEGLRAGGRHAARALNSPDRSGDS